MTIVYILSSALFVVGLSAIGINWFIYRNLKKLIRNDPYAYHIRKKICKALDVIPNNLLSKVESGNSTDPSNRLARIMKYGFPGLDDIRLYTDFVLSYDRRNRVAHWVYEHLTRDSLLIGSNAIRTEFQADMEIPSTFRSYPEDYRNSGYDRGHLAAAGNHRATQSRCSETFFLTNIAPQVGKGFNQNAWNRLENRVRELTERYGSVYICTGPLYLPSTKTKDEKKWVVEYEVIGPNSVAVPTHFFKVIIVESELPNGIPDTEAYLMPNAVVPDGLDIRIFLCDIRDIESASGLQFFQGNLRNQIFESNYPSTDVIWRNFDVELQ